MSTRATSAELTAPTTPPKRIFVVDDTPDFLAIVAMLLENQNYKAFLRSAGRDAFSTIKRQRPDLVILDVMLPDADGVDVLRRLKSDDSTRAIPVIICSGARQRLRSQRAEIETLAAALLEKPVDLDDLLLAVQEALGDGC